MKFVSILVVSIILSACSSSKPKGPGVTPELANPVISAPPVPSRKSCEDLAEIFRKAIYYDGIQFRFVENPGKALSFLKQVDLEKLRPNTLAESRKVIANCGLPTSEANCSLSLPAFEFFNGLFYGIKNYDWPVKTKEAGIGLFVKYGKLIAGEKTSLVDIELVTDLVSRLVRENSRYRSLRKRVSALKKDLDRTREELRDEQLRTQANAYQCHDLNQLLLIEEQFLGPFADRLSAILGSIKY